MQRCCAENMTTSLVHNMELNELGTTADEQRRTRPPRSPFKYGWGRFTPSWLQRFHTPKWLLVWLCVFGAGYNLSASGLLPSALSTLERRFGLNSTQVGFMYSTYEASSLLLLFIVAHYAEGEKGHKGRWIGWGSVVFAIGTVLFIIPHFAAGQHQWWIGVLENGTVIADTCVVNGTFAGNIDPDNPPVDSANRFFYLFVFAQIVHGLAASPLVVLVMPYLDENVAQKDSPFYQSLYLATCTLASAVGYVVGGLLLHIYGDIDKVDPSTWIGYVISTIICIITAVPILGFARELPEKQELRKNDILQTHQSKEYVGCPNLATDLRHYPQAIKVLLKNPVFTCNVLRNCLSILLGSGVMAFLPLYLQQQYGYDESVSSIITGLTCVPPFMIGCVIGGYAVRRLRLKVKGFIKFAMVLGAIGGLVALGFLFGCDSRPLAGVNAPYEFDPSVSIASFKNDVRSHNLAHLCNAACNCKLDTVTFDPICDPQTGLTYYSPCFAGCHAKDKRNNSTTYFDCACAPLGHVLQHGACPVSATCRRKSHWFMATWIISAMVLAAGAMAETQASQRAVPFSQRTFAGAVAFFTVRLLGQIPGPIIMGMIMDKACTLWRTDGGQKQQCLYYDNHLMTIGIVALGVVCKTAAFALLVLSYYLYKAPDEEIKLAHKVASRQTSSTSTTHDD